jgi:hypothetical protein
VCPKKSVMDNVLEWLSVNSTYVLIFVGCALAIIAMAQFELSRRSSQRQIRAYVVPDSGELFVGETGEPRARIALRNCGQTPARGVLSWAKIDLIEPGRDENLDLPQAGVRSGRTLAANACLNKALWFRTLSAEEEDHVRSGSMAICVSGSVEYNRRLSASSRDPVPVCLYRAFPASAQCKSRSGRSQKPGNITRSLAGGGVPLYPAMCRNAATTSS